MQVKLIRTLLGSQAPECPNMDISTNTWNEIITLALGKNSGLTSKFNPYYDDVSFMAGALSSRIRPRSSSNPEYFSDPLA